MRPLPALLIAALFLTATMVPVAGTYPTQDRTQTSDPPVQSITTIPNTTNQLTIPDGEVQRTNYNDSGIDVGTAADTWSTQLQYRHDTLAFEERFQRTRTDKARSELVTDRLGEIEARQRALDRRQSNAIRQYASGEITAAELLRTRLVVNAEADELLESLDRLSEAPDTAPDYSLNDSVTNRMRTIEGELRTLTGPIGYRLESEDETTANRIYYIEASYDGYMIATVTDDRYVRETKLSNVRNPDEPDQFLSRAVNDGDTETDRLDIAIDRAADLYPWLYERQRPSFTFYGTSAIYELTATHPNGELTAYLDGGTTDIFYEEQFRQLSSVRTTATERAVNESLAVTVRRSTDTGPLLVEAANNESDAAVDGTVRINGQRVGSTGSDGVIWTVEPRGDYTVTVATGSSTTTVAVRPE